MTMHATAPQADVRSEQQQALARFKTSWLFLLRKWEQVLVIKVLSALEPRDTD